MPGEQKKAPLCSIELHTNGLIMTPNYQMALVKKKPRSLPGGGNAKQRQQLLWLNPLKSFTVLELIWLEVKKSLLQITPLDGILWK